MYFFTSTDDQEPGNNDVCRSLQNYGFSVWKSLRIAIMAPTLFITYYQNYQMMESEMVADCTDVVQSIKYIVYIMQRVCFLCCEVPVNTMMTYR